MVVSYRIRNYMSKPWFLKIAMEAEPSALSKKIGEVLGNSAKTTNGVNGVKANGVNGASVAVNGKK